MVDGEHIVCILPLKGNRRVLGRLRSALQNAARQRDAAGERGGVAATDMTAVQSAPAHWPPRRVPLSEAAFAPRELLPPEEATGRVSAACVGRYPPGVAWLTPGDEMTQDILDLISQTPQERLFGLDGGLLPCVALAAYTPPTTDKGA